MLGVAGTIVAAIMMIAFELPNLRKNKLTKELWVFSILMLIAVGLGIAQSLDLHIPNPLIGITYIFKPFSDFIYGFLK
ncbi:hypothetical protein E2K98_20645 [Bacillus salipaludis]|uniref:Uncharacterized protein n=1 Tax=Bacillus salipaludis TaxID=2547811 RepID=A0A4R5VLZ8_9BACI|nr:hypothetical protein [Bacillus salipaludis]MDQ6596117.1 hypothetical protein [Bacillus salipaludis]TDK59112.1 hypothetical protein E2K98_20645 [Bacillus salipaludis]